MKTIDELLAEDTELENQRQAKLREATALFQKQRQARLELIRQRLGIAEGMVVRYGTEKFRLSRINTEFCWSQHESFRPWVKGNKIKKDGTVSEHERELYKDWVIIES